MKIESFTFNPFQENTYIIYDENKECLIIDPGCYTKDEKEMLKDFILTKGLKPVKLINTHCHIDHILGNRFCHEQWGVQLHMHEADLPILENSKQISKMYGFEDYEDSPLPKYFLNQDDIITFGESNFNILFTPGHAPGHICLYSKKNNIIISGDLIFQKSIGRTDLPGGDYNTLIDSINTQILPLPDETRIYCGHGPYTDLGFEKKYNPFLQ